MRPPDCCPSITTLALALVAATVLLAAACAQSPSSPSNLTAEQRERLQKFADEMEREVYFRPVLPTYVPAGFDPLPIAFDRSEGHLAMDFRPQTDDTSNTPAPIL